MGGGGRGGREEGEQNNFGTLTLPAIPLMSLLFFYYSVISFKLRSERGGGCYEDSHRHV